MTGQERVLAALKEITADGWPASVREVGAACGFTSPSTTHLHLHRLRSLGLAVQHPRNDAGGWLPAPGPHVERPQGLPLPRYL